jgi:prophage maintenance system killer protein
VKGDFSDRMNYYRALEKVQINHERDDFFQLIAQHVYESLKEHIYLSGN